MKITNIRSKIALSVKKVHSYRQNRKGSYCKNVSK
nr:MAG TPA: U4/U6 small nuclear ribonucleoprotein [Caudoviricetes sp.]DAR36853.1 MAG TPA: U4/U6 small nuclear ribonucleoprotein [Caudoviricetes sp.]